MNHSMPTNLIIYTKWTNSLKNMICQNSHKNKQSDQACSKDINNLPKEKAQGPDEFTIFSKKEKS